MINQEALVEFKKLYLKEYGAQLTDQQALEYGTRLINLVKAVYRNRLPINSLTKQKKGSYHEAGSS